MDTKRKDGEHTGGRMQVTELPGRRKGGRPKRRSLDLVKENVFGCVIEEYTEDRVRKQMTHSGNPQGLSYNFLMVQVLNGLDSLAPSDWFQTFFLSHH